jgi:hypothetical protein
MACRTAWVTLARARSEADCARRLRPPTDCTRQLIDQEVAFGVRSCGAFSVSDRPRLRYVLIDLCQPTSVCILRTRVEQLAGVPRDRGSQPQLGRDSPARGRVALAHDQVHDMELAPGVGEKTAEIPKTL